MRYEEGVDEDDEEKQHVRTRQLLIATVVASAACSNQETPTGGDFRDVPADMIMTGMTQQMTSNGLRRARLMGDTAYIFDDSSKVKVKGVNLHIYNEAGADIATLTAKAGDFDTTTQGMIARGNVVLVTVTEPRRRIETEELYYDPQQHKIWSNVKTVMTEGGSRVTGSGFNADDKFQNVRITGVTGRVGGMNVRF